MKVLFLTLLGAVLALGVAGKATHAPTTAPSTTPGPTMEDRMKELEGVLHGLSRQVMLQQFFVEEKIRSDGSSGLKQTRVQKDGTQNFYAAAFTERSFLSMHDHANYDRTVGMGELMPVMNGVEFRTRHNDYKLRMPSRTSSDYHAVENIPFPEVPKTVLDKKTVDIRYTSYTGSKSVLENYAYLPTTIIGVENGIPHYAQWNYRILCHPLSEDLPTSAFKAEDDLMYRFPHRKTVSQMKDSRAERFRLNAKDDDHYNNGRSLLDNLMMQIPGKDNYQADLHDNSFDMVMEDVRYNNHTLINTGYYHRYFKTLDKGAMGIKSIHRGFSDANLWVAQTTQAKVAPLSVESCHKDHGHQVCKSWSSRYTYALPLEVVYMTPLASWNPYDLAEDIPFGQLRSNGRIGGATNATAYNGTNYKGYFYRTPVEFYSSGTVEKDPADTAKKGAGILDKNGEVRMVSSSGVRIRTPAIDGVGVVRLRYPIMPIHGEGSGVWKELNALKEMTMHMNRYSSLFDERPGQGGNGTDAFGELLHYQMALTHMDPPGEHSHDFTITSEELDEVKSGHHITVTTSEDMGHSHILELQIRRGHQLFIRRCDGNNNCWDGHSHLLTKLDN